MGKLEAILQAILSKQTLTSLLFSDELYRKQIPLVANGSIKAGNSELGEIKEPISRYHYLDNAFLCNTVMYQCAVICKCFTLAKIRFFHEKR